MQAAARDLRHAVGARPHRASSPKSSRRLRSLLQSTRSASRRSRSDTLRASKLTARTPPPIGVIVRVHQPGARGVLGAERELELARMRAREAQMDVLELRLVAGAHVVDDEVAALEADLGEVAAVEAQRARGCRANRGSARSFSCGCACRHQRVATARDGGAADVDGATDASDTVVASGRCAAPVDTDSRPSDSTRIASSAPTRLMRSARGATAEQARAR